ncbi:universal stress protein [Chondromyces crocatus]|uniref:Universal stress protein n=1 Tax=Chondromyces crocatus TaxID=52 RepID=A0A0K1E748_CHOCO|nr:universal stress protein [Chondromyces crocatus]AKT36403.1 universal stress protein [Chondromyces crocatus]
MSLKHPKIIVAALDTSQRAAGVLEEAVDLAQKLGGKVLLVRAVGIPHEIPPEALSATPNAVPEILGRIAREDLEQRARAVPEGLLHGIQVRTGVGWQVICDEADAADADLIVIGSHGYQGIDRLLGTTASRVVNHATRSVLVVREKPVKSA